jgi:ferric-dicitrate binding protein FerR (iron transport regulator)
MDSELVLWYKTAHGQPRVVKQPDGSILTDDLKSVLTVRYFQAQRLLYTASAPLFPLFPSL